LGEEEEDNLIYELKMFGRSDSKSEIAVHASAKTSIKAEETKKTDR